jgi:hypothetical protein
MPSLSVEKAFADEPDRDEQRATKRAKLDSLAYGNYRVRAVMLLPVGG